MKTFYQIHFSDDNGKTWEPTGLGAWGKAKAVKAAGWYRQGAKEMGKDRLFKLVPIPEEE